MQKSSNDEGTILALMNRLNNERLPYALKLKKRVDTGERLTEHDMQFLSQVLEDAGEARKLADKHADLQPLVARLAGLYAEITKKALDNEQKSQGAER